jgi:DNA primase
LSGELNFLQRKQANGVTVSFSFDPDTKERVRAATDLVDLIGSRLELRRQGSGYVCKCPWHNDTRPSLQVDPNRQIWKCWVCDIGGDCFSYVMRTDGVTFGEAVNMLAERAGINIEPVRGHKAGSAKPTTEIKAELFKVLRWAEEFFHRFLLESPQASAARDYLVQRGINEQSIHSFHLGMSPDSWSALLDAAVKQKFDAALLDAAGLVVKRERGTGYYDRFRNRLMFPIRDREDRTIAFGGRVMPGSSEGAKYINSPETRLFQKSRQLYGYDVAHMPILRHRQAIVMEGYTDVIVAHQAGVDNAVAVLGTALGPSHLKTLRHQCESVVLLLDGDEAGQRRSDEVLELFLNAQMDVRIVTLPDGLDPADFLIERGLDKFKAVMDSACDALEFRLRRATAGFDPLLDTFKAQRAVEEILSLLAKVPASGLISNEAFRIRQNQIMPRLARQFAIPEDALREQLSAMRSKQSRLTQPDRSRQPNASEEATARLYKPSDLSPFERELLELIIIAPQVAPIALERVQSGWLECEAAQVMFDVYQQLDFSGASLEFESVLITLEDISLKSLLVTLHEQAHAKLAHTRESAEQRLLMLTQRLGERHEELRRQKMVEQLQKGVSETEQLDILQDVIRQARLRQGLKHHEPSVKEKTDEPDRTRDNDVPVNR